MDAILKELASTPGLKGAFVYHAKAGLLGNTLPPAFTSAKVETMGRVLTKIHAAGCMNFPELSDFTLSLDESTIFVRDVPGKALVALVGGPAFNVNMAALSLQMVIDDLADALLAQGAPEPAAHPPGETAPKAAALSPEALMESRTLGPTLQSMQAALAKVVGPMAGVIFLECLERWTGEVEPRKENLPRLLALLLPETGGDEQEVRYRKLVEPLL
jgi:hypothetical protein